MKPSKIAPVSAAVLLTIALSACDSKSVTTKENYAKAVQRYLDATDAVCVWSTRPAPFEYANIRVWERQQADQFVKVGLLAKEPTTVRDYGQSLPGARYTLTDAGKKASRGVVSGLGNRFCGGKAKLMAIDEPSAGVKVQTGDQVYVHYVAQLVDRPTWDDESVLVGHIELAATTDNQFKGETFLILTDDGWKVVVKKT
ncbi:hypothetical protein [Paraburkholderia caledonica]|uniref:hypothetical protein n=1 Tax=Paraburkholderia caledonica TaxID=134536 RepID=UPI000DF0085B|nr:hypothetical protein [Paraburkholderia caledonica]AXF18783.1 hypothetical protein CUJ87_30900 [Paraburkholderia caledonica]